MAQAFTGTKPKAFNRRFWLNVGTADAPEWAEIAQGIASRGVKVSEATEQYFYMNGRGTGEVESASQTIVRSFVGSRFLGDAAQDAIFINKMYDLDQRQVEFIECYDNAPAGWAAQGNGYRGLASVKIDSDGGGEAGAREGIAFSLLYLGQPQRGTVSMEHNEPKFVAV